MTVPAAHEYRTYPVVTLPVFDLRTGDVVVGTDSEVVGIDAESPWTRRISERHPSGQITRFAYDCADELTVYRKPEGESDAIAAAEAESAAEESTERLAGVRCPRCSNERAFAVQITVSVVLDGDLDISDPRGRSPTTRPAASADPPDGFRGDEPIQCHQDRGGCGHRGTVDEFRIPEGDVTAR